MSLSELVFPCRAISPNDLNCTSTAPCLSTLIYPYNLQRRDKSSAFPTLLDFPLLKIKTVSHTSGPRHGQGQSTVDLVARNQQGPFFVTWKTTYRATS